MPQLRKLAPQAAIVIVTGHADIQGTVAAIRQGAADYIIKPIDAAELRTRVGRIAEHRRAEVELQSRIRILRSVMETIHDAVMVVDEQGKVLLFNPAVRQLIGPVAVGEGAERWPQFGRAFQMDRTTPFTLADLALMRALHGQEVIDVEQYIRRPEPAPGVLVMPTPAPCGTTAAACAGRWWSGATSPNGSGPRKGCCNLNGSPRSAK